MANPRVALLIAAALLLAHEVPARAQVGAPSAPVLGPLVTANAEESTSLATDLLFVLPDGETAVVLGDGAETPGEHAFERIVSLPHVGAVRAPLAPEDVPEGARGWAGVALRLFSAGGEVCTATIERFELRGRLVFPDPDDWGHPSLDDFDSGSSYLVGVVDGDCDGAVWGQRAELPAPVVHAFVPSASPPDLSEEALLSAFHALPEYARVADDNLAEGVDPFDRDDWEHHDGARPLFAHAPDSPWGRLGFVGTTAGIGCGELFGRLWSLFALDETGPLRVLGTGQGDYAGYYRPLSLLEYPDGRCLILFDTLSGRVLYDLGPGGIGEVRALQSRLAHGC